MALVRFCLTHRLLDLYLNDFLNRGDVWKFCWKGRFTRNGETVFRTWCVPGSCNYNPPTLTRYLLDMLTPIDQPLDKLEDLKPDEM